MSSSPRFLPPLRGGFNPGSTPNVTTPGSFANAPDVGGPLTFSSPDAPGMPAPSDKTAWDFLPELWSVSDLGAMGHQPWSGDVQSASPHVSDAT